MIPGYYREHYAWRVVCLHCEKMWSYLPKVCVRLWARKNPDTIHPFSAQMLDTDLIFSISSKVIILVLCIDAEYSKGSTQTWSAKSGIGAPLPKFWKHIINIKLHCFGRTAHIIFQPLLTLPCQTVQVIPAHKSSRSTDVVACLHIRFSKDKDIRNKYNNITRTHTSDH